MPSPERSQRWERKGVNMKKVISLMTAIILILGVKVDCQAKANLSALQNGGWNNLSYQDKCDTTTALVNKISKELGIKNTPRTHYFDWANSKMAAYSYMNPNDIYINTDILSNPENANIVGMTLEQYLIKVVAHEVRHVYQSEHRNDNTEFGRQCKYCFEHYVTYDQNANGYNSQFIEQDADAYGLDYANRFLKIKNKGLVATNGKQFDAAFYASKYPDVKKALGTDSQVLLNHYNTYGIKERRMANANDV